MNTTTGLLVFIAVVAHDFADGMNTVSFILSQSDNRQKALKWLAVDAIAPLIGAIVGASLSISEYALGHLLALYAGFFLFMGATDLLPEAHQHPVSAAGRVDRDGVRVDLPDRYARARLAESARHASCAATSSTRTAKRRRSVASGSALAVSTPSSMPPTAASPMIAAVRQRTFP